MDAPLLQKRLYNQAHILRSRFASNGALVIENFPNLNMYKRQIMGIYARSTKSQEKSPSPHVGLLPFFHVPSPSDPVTPKFHPMSSSCAELSPHRVADADVGNKQLPAVLGSRMLSVGRKKACLRCGESKNDRRLYKEVCLRVWKSKGT